MPVYWSVTDLVQQAVCHGYGAEEGHASYIIIYCIISR